MAKRKYAECTGKHGDIFNIASATIHTVPINRYAAKFYRFTHYQPVKLFSSFKGNRKCVPSMVIDKVVNNTVAELS